AALAAWAEERNRHVLLAIDESHLLTCEQLEAVCMLTSHGMDYASPLTILLIGQPTLRRLLLVVDMAAIDQLLQLHYHIPPPARHPARRRSPCRQIAIMNVTFMDTVNGREQRHEELLITVRRPAVMGARPVDQHRRACRTEPADLCHTAAGGNGCPV